MVQGTKSDMALKKQKLRNKSKDLFKSQTKEDLQVLSLRVSENLKKLLSNQWEKPAKIACFKPLADEVSLDLSSLPYYQFAYPRVEGNTMDFYQFKNSKKNQYLKNKWGIEEPEMDSSIKLEKSDFDAFLVPGLFFDRSGGRLGRGKAFYDRYLKDCRQPKVGIAFGFQLAEAELPMDQDDVRMNYIVTENEVIGCEVNEKWKI